jgi:hypothetical protein
VVGIKVIEEQVPHYNPNMETRGRRFTATAPLQVLTVHFLLHEDSSVERPSLDRSTEFSVNM